MNSSDIMELLVEVERRYPVAQWIAGGVRIWPLIRIKLYYNLFLQQISGDKSAAVQTNMHGRLVQGARVACGIGRYLNALTRDRAKNRRPAGSVDVVFLSDGVSFSKISGEWYEKFCDPLIARLGHAQVSSFLISPLHEYLIPRRTPSLFVQPWIDLLKVRGTIFPADRGEALAALPEFDPFVSFLGELGLEGPLPQRSGVARDTAMLMHIARYYEGLLRRLDPAVALLVSYYSLEGMAFVLACRRLGIPCADIQHGVAGELHAAYGRWTCVPNDGYELLPSLFWCWSDHDAVAVRRWADSLDDLHRALVGGNPWLNLWIDGNEDFVADYDRQVIQAMRATMASTHVFVTLQFGLAQPEQLDGLLGAMVNSPRSWQWWIRLHPSVLGEREVIRALLRDHGIRRFEIDLATDLPLYAWLRHMHAHVTHSSSTVVEATAYGLPTILLSNYGADLFHEYVRAGWARVALNSSSILEAVSAQTEQRGRLDPTAVPLSSRDREGFAVLQALVRRQRELRGCAQGRAVA